LCRQVARRSPSLRRRRRRRRRLRSQNLAADDCVPSCRRDHVITTSGSIWTDRPATTDVVLRDNGGCAASTDLVLRFLDLRSPTNSLNAPCIMVQRRKNESHVTTELLVRTAKCCSRRLTATDCKPFSKSAAHFVFY